MAKSITGEVLKGAGGSKTATVNSPARTASGEIDFERIEQSPGFKKLMDEKKKFLIPVTILFLGLYLLFNVIISYTTWLEGSFIGDISWVWVFAFALFIMTWTLVTVYMKRAAKFDELANETLVEFGYEETEEKR